MDNQVFLPTKTQLKRRYVCQTTTCKKPLIKLGHKSAQIGDLSRANTPNWLHQKNPKQFLDAIQSSKNISTKLQHLIFLGYSAKKSDSTFALGVRKLEKIVTTKTNVTHEPLDENTICLNQIVDRLSSYTPTNFQQLSPRKFFTYLKN
jgi:hypothetical protein